MPILITVSVVALPVDIKGAAPPQTARSTVQVGGIEEMFQMVENVQAGEAESSRRQLPLQFPTRAAAIEHIELLQAQFMHRGRNEERNHWWARNDNEIELYRWWIESDK